FRNMELELSTHQADKYRNCVHKKDRRGGLFGYCLRLKARLPSWTIGVPRSESAAQSGKGIKNAV
ncbi:hypothetical protein, partial [Neisseria lactamica]|uniref:hypothetical protein n=1 Tax=Neisseria lactamica TaxID=486 RepID=UPI00195C9310